MPVQTRSMIRHVEEEKKEENEGDEATHQLNFEEIYPSTEETYERELNHTIRLHLEEIDELRKNVNLNSQLIVIKTIKVYRLTEKYLKFLDGIETRKEEGRQCKLITIGKIAELKHDIKNSRDYNARQRKMFMKEFDRYTKSVIHLFN